jgi:hypothetical protein
MKRWGHVCAGIGATLAVAAVLSVYGFSTLDIATARETEAKMLGAEGAAEAPR